MKKKLRIWISLLFFAISVVFAGVWIWQNDHSRESMEYAFRSMDTWCSVLLSGDREACRRGVKRVEEIFRSVEESVNIFDPDSELARLNSRTEAGDIYELSEILQELFMISYQAYALTGGTFDPAVLPLLEVYKKGDPSPAEVEYAKELAGVTEAAEISGNKLKIMKSGVKFDFGGIAKGYALDRAAEACMAVNGVTGGVINAGGNIIIFGDMESLEIAFADPDMPERDGGTFLLHSGMACASSGDYRRGRHIIDPETGKRAEVLHGVTVIAPGGTESDYWSTALFVNPELGFPPDICSIIPDGRGGFIWRNKPVNQQGKSETEFRLNDTERVII